MAYTSSGTIHSGIIYLCDLYMMYGIFWQVVIDICVMLKYFILSCFFFDFEDEIFLSGGDCNDPEISII